MDSARPHFRGVPRRPLLVLVLTLASATGALAVVSLSARRTYRALEAAAAQRQTAYEFLMALRQLRQHVGEARVGLTGYVLTRDSVYRATYVGGIGGLARDTVALRALARGQATLEAYVDRLGPALVAYAEAMVAAMQSAERGPPSALSPELRRSRDVLLLEGVRGVIVALEGEQKRLMEVGARHVTHGVWRSRAIISTVLVVGVVLILGAGGAVSAQLLARERVAQALRERQQQLASIYDTVADVVFQLAVERDGGYRFTSVNQAFRSVTGLDYDRVVGKRVNEVVPEPSLTLVLEKCGEAIREERIVRWEETSEYPTGRLTGEVSVAPVLDDAGNCTHLVGAVHDITARKRAEEALEARVAERTAELQAVNQDLEAFAYSVSHDLRAPLRAADGFSRMLIEDHGAHLDEEGRRVANVIRTSTQRMGRLIDDLLAFSRLGRQETQAVELDMAQLVHGVIAEVSSLEPQRQIEFRVGAVPPAIGDPSLLKQVWLNLLSNAVKYTRPRERAVIHVAGTIEGGEVVYTVSDNGVGFDMRYADKLFAVFERLHTAPEFEGTGVGLALVQRIVGRHGGRAWAEGKPDEGAVFSFALPRKEAELPANGQGGS